MIDARLLNLRLQAEGRTVQPDHNLMLWAHDEIERLRAALETIVEKDQWFHEGARCDGEFAKIARASLHIHYPIGGE